MSTLVRTTAVVDLEAIRANAERLGRAASGAMLMAVVKGNAYGHGAVPVAAAALAGGAERLAVATVGEAEELRAAAIDAPLLVLGAVTPSELDRVAATGAELVVWTPECCAAATSRGIGVHLKLDTGMGRLGARLDERDGLLDAGSRARVVGVMTHFASADARTGEHAAFMGEQLIRFRALAAELRERFPDALLHVANSAATLRDPSCALDMVRCGIALYGCSPFGDDPAVHELRPALTWRSWLASVKLVRSRESVGYGRTHRAARGSRIGVVPVGYADGYARAYGNRAEVLVAGRRVPVVGNVSMDQLTVDLGPESTEQVGEEVVLLGGQGEERILAEELAAWRESINYEVVCAISPRVERRWTG